MYNFEHNLLIHNMRPVNLNNGIIPFEIDD